MKIVFSYITDKKNNAYNEHYLELAALANYLVKLHYPQIETIFYGDDVTLQSHKNINYNHFEKVSLEQIKKYPNFLWSLGKLVSVYNLNEPFLHLDLDLLLFRPLKKEIFEKDIVCFHTEPFSTHLMQQMQEIVNIRPEETNPYSLMSHNCAIFGGIDYLTIKKSINLLLNFIENNCENLNASYIKYQKRPNNEKIEYFDLSILAEQVWLFQYFQHFNKEIYKIVKVDDLVNSYQQMMKETGYVHLISWGKLFHKNKIKEIVNRLDIKY